MITSYQSNRIIDGQFGSVSNSIPANLYFGLSTTAPSFDGTGATEPSGNAYARVTVANNKTSFTSAALGIITNAISITFPESTGSWGTITYCLIYDASTAGNLMYYEALPVSRAVPTLTTVLFAVGALSVQMNNT